MDEQAKDSHLRNIRIQLLDYLFDKGHDVNKPLIDDASDFVLMYATSWYEQGKIASKASKED